VATGGDALNWVVAAPYDLIVLDVMLPELNGLDLCRQIRQHGIPTPVLMLTARDAVADRVSGLDAGADDYLVKPFAMVELLARLRALSRRSEPQAKDIILTVADLTLDTTTHRVHRGGNPIELTAKEYAVLEYLLRESGRVLTRTMISEHVWNFDDDNQSNVVDVYIRNLRRKIDDAHDVKLIHTIRGVGYRLEVREPGEMA
jgi:DNA-binding response OmpR family regulator